MSKNLWLEEYERIGEALDAGEITTAEAADRMKALGFDHDEIEDHLERWLA